MLNVFRVLIGTSLLSLVLVLPASASPVGWFVGSTPGDVLRQADEIASRRIDQLFTDMQKLSDQWLQEGTDKGNLLLVQGGNQLQMVVAAARMQFGAELSHQVRDASQQLRPFIDAMLTMKKEVHAGEEKLVDLEDLLALDLQNLPLADSCFCIRRILGTAVVENAGDSYKVVVRGKDFGITGKDRIFFDARLDGQPLGNPVRVGPDDAEFEIAEGVLKSRFNPHKATALDLKLVITRKGSWFSGEDHIDYVLKLSLLPDEAGNLLVSVIRPKYVWKALDPPQTNTVLVERAQTITMQVPTGVIAGLPQLNQQKWDDTSLAFACKPASKAARVFKSGAVVFADDPIFSKGWQTQRYLGAKKTDWEDADKEIMRTWGFGYNTWAVNACGPLNSGQHCFVPAKVLLDNSVPIAKLTTGDQFTSKGACNCSGVAARGFSSGSAMKPSRRPSASKRRVHAVTLAWKASSSSRPASWSSSKPW